MGDKAPNQEEQIIMDNDFWSAPPKDQAGYLSSLDHDFANASPQEQAGYIQHLRQQRESYAPPMPKIQSDMKPSYLGLAIQNSPSNADPHNPGNANPEILNQMDPKARKEVEDKLRDTAVATMPLAYGEGASMMGHFLKPVTNALFAAPRAAQAGRVGFLAEGAQPAEAGGLVPRAVQAVKSGYAAIPEPVKAVAKYGIGLETLHHMLPKLKMPWEP